MTSERPEDAAAVERELERIVAEAETRLAEVRRELAERRRRSAEHAAQHAEIDRLEEHLANATVRWGEVRDFFDDVITHLRAPGDPQEPEAEGGTDRDDPPA
ncbi:hypothetical protein [Isoptericola sp. BMS4]|uniref:hypothetical protein n=1 Tax=Isoptericola sp. BMS4 TaxID=2527875 RepID=UPI0014228DC3|nr:hypothetical protein [Isoptericola sp. BMS4]